MKTVEVENLKEGQLIDLEGCKYLNDSTKRIAECQYFEVWNTEQETPNTTLLVTNHANVGLPKGYKVSIKEA